jgi:hypothetical protein
MRWLLSQVEVNRLWLTLSKTISTISFDSPLSSGSMRLR